MIGTRRLGDWGTGGVVGLALLLFANGVFAQTVAITNAKLYPISSPAIERGTVVIRDGNIAAVGAEVSIPAGATIINANGKVVTPGLLDSSTGLGTVEISGQAEGTNDLSTNYDHITAAFNVADNLNPYSTLVPVTRVEGI